MTNNEKEARRRVAEAHALIRSAFRLEYLNATEVVNGTRSAIAAGLEDAAKDGRREADAA